MKTTLTLLAVGVLGMPAAAHANATDDKLYCRFFQDGADTDPQSLQELTGIEGAYWYSDAGDDYWYYQFSLGKGMVVGFSQESGRAWSASAIGFEPGVDYWRCH
jgi:hypothetical protein